MTRVQGSTWGRLHRLCYCPVIGVARPGGRNGTGVIASGPERSEGRVAISPPPRVYSGGLLRSFAPRNDSVFLTALPPFPPYLLTGISIQLRFDHRMVSGSPASLIVSSLTSF